MALKINISILIDLGMTGTAREYAIRQPAGEFSSVRHHRLDKVPTQLSYGNTNEVVPWGSACQTNHGIKKLFKGSFAFSQDSRTSELSKKWISDYLHQFCSHILDEVLIREGFTREQLNAKWCLTMPGCWSDHTQLDFKMHAGNVLRRILPECEVIADVTESLASCEFLAQSFRFPRGTWAITCDIGGATCDTALATMNTDGTEVPEVFPVLSTECSSTSASVQVVDRLLHRQIMKLQGSINTEQFKDLATQLVDSTPWKCARHAFDGSADVIFTAEQDFGKLKRSLTSYSRTMEHIFVPFLDGLCREIDECIRLMAERTGRHSKPNIIALCGGGGTMAYPLKQLKFRYSHIEIKASSSTEESRLATIIGHSIYRSRYAMDDYFGEIVMGVSSAKKVSTPQITWNEKPTRTTGFDFSSRKQTALHDFIVYRKDYLEALPILMDILKKGVSEPCQSKGVLVIPLRVTLKAKFLHKQKYFIEVTCSEQDRFSFKACDAENPSVEFDLVWDNYDLGC
ncbi:uncharacterized protein BP5553_06558 [Venustampulla echinocandica]|uniref:Actin-like ATPase domain-containing protein n=1 Tax=Venustampulla echinocandica TaxID=2656787 RepID=A0A370TK99_9HELO|nr:uncharacterized protein BP5553_06558 [Venustampulla echinocandica]RDL35946.1 hypothetical protein BP5553_06558 [Venustampulla echinocandica]